MPAVSVREEAANSGMRNVWQGKEGRLDLDLYLVDAAFFPAAALGHDPGWSWRVEEAGKQQALCLGREGGVGWGGL